MWGEMLKNELFHQKTCIYHLFTLFLQHLYLRFRNYRNHLFGLVRPASTPFFMPFQGVFHAVMKGSRLKKVNNQLHFCSKIIVFQRKVVPLQPLPRDGSIKFKPNLN
jgi:hypothetical protein